MLRTTLDEKELARNRFQNTFRAGLTFFLSASITQLLLTSLTYVFLAEGAFCFRTGFTDFLLTSIAFLLDTFRALLFLTRIAFRLVAVFRLLIIRYKVSMSGLLFAL